MGQTINQTTCRVKMMRYKLTGISWVWKGSLDGIISGPLALGALWYLLPCRLPAQWASGVGTFGPDGAQARKLWVLQQ